MDQALEIAIRRKQPRHYTNDMHVQQRVQSHYNARRDRGHDARKISRIFNLRCFNNYVVEVLLLQCTQTIRPIEVLELAGGKGGAEPKWHRIHRAIGCPVVWTMQDIAHRNVTDAEERHRKTHATTSTLGTRFFHSNMCDPRGCGSLAPANQPQYDVVSIQFAIHYAFASVETLEGLVRTLATSLRPGGHCVGSTVNRERLRTLCTEDSFQNRVCSINFTGPHRYRFSLDGAVDGCEEYEVDWDQFNRVAAPFGMRLAWTRPFLDHNVRDYPEIARVTKADRNPMTQDEAEVANLYDIFMVTRE
jgi:mRNA (guanine-N7-)-methyltransferase